MKRLHRNKGDPTRSVRAIPILVAAGATSLLLVLGGTKALSVGAASGPLSKHVREHRGFAGAPCTKEGCTPPLLYKVGAGVQTKPAVYLIFWGSKWNTGVGSKLAGRAKSLIQGLSGSSYQGILTQYFDTKGRVGSKLTLTSYVDTKVAAPAGVNDATIQEEVNSAISTNSWTREFNAQFIVLSAPGSTYAEGFNKGFCGYHEVTTVGKSAYGFVAYLGEEPFLKCTGEAKPSEKRAEDATLATLSHEYAELATDPFDPITWATSDTKALYEIGDLCEIEGETASGLWVQELWDNFKGECVLEDASPAFVYAVTEPATEVTEKMATLNGMVNPESLTTEYFFEWGTTTSYGSKTAVSGAGSGRANVKVKASITGLTHATTYHFRLVAKNSTGTGNGLDKEFKAL